MKLQAGEGVERSEGLVEEDDRWIGGQGAGEGDSLALPSGKLGGVAGGMSVGREPDQLQHLSYPRFAAIRIPAQETWDQVDVALHPPVGDEPAVLGDVADPPPQGDGIELGDEPAVYPNLSLGRIDHAVEQAEKSGLAAATLADQGQRLSGWNLQAHPGERGRAVGIRLDDSFGFQGGHQGSLVRKEDAHLPRERLKFPGSQDHELVGWLETRDATPVAYAIFCHCFTCSKDIKAAGRISRALAERGIAVLRFDFTGIGESEGDFAETDFSSNLEDLIAAADFLRSEREAPRLLIGHSLGGAAVLCAAPRIPEVSAVATIAAPSDTEHLRDTLVRLSPELEARGEAEIDLGGGRPFRIRQQLLDDLSEDHLQQILGNLGKPLLLFHSPLDRTVAVENAERLFLAAKHPKSFVSLGTADHLLSDERDALHAGEVLAAWARRYL